MYVIAYKTADYAHWRVWEVTYASRERAEAKRRDLTHVRRWHTSTVKPIALERHP